MCFTGGFIYFSTKWSNIITYAVIKLVKNIISIHVLILILLHIIDHIITNKKSKSTKLK